MAFEDHNLHIGLLTPALLEDNGELNLADSKELDMICGALTDSEKGIRAETVLFISEGNLAAIETAHHMSEVFCLCRRSTRRFAPEQNFWMRRTAEEVVLDLCRREMFYADLWIFVGQMEHLLSVMKLLIPLEYAKLDDFDPASVPSVVFLGVSLKRDMLFGNQTSTSSQ